jgi:hypothetical protein
VNPCNEFVVTDIAVIIGSKGELPPHTFIKVTSLPSGDTAQIAVSNKTHLNLAKSSQT